MEKTLFRDEQAYLDLLDSALLDALATFEHSIGTDDRLVVTVQSASNDISDLIAALKAIEDVGMRTSKHPSNLTVSTEGVVRYSV